MSKYKLYEKVILTTTKEETTIIKLFKKGTAGRNNDFYLLDCNKDRAFTEHAIEPIRKALYKSEKKNECEGCNFLIKQGYKKDFCFYSNELLYTYINSDIKPRLCIKDTDKYKQLLKGDNDG